LNTYVDGWISYLGNYSNNTLETPKDESDQVLLLIIIENVFHAIQCFNQSEPAKALEHLADMESSIKSGAEKTTLNIEKMPYMLDAQTALICRVDIYLPYESSLKAIANLKNFQQNPQTRPVYAPTLAGFFLESIAQKLATNNE